MEHLALQNCGTGHIWLKLPRDYDFYETWSGLFLTVAFQRESFTIHQNFNSYSFDRLGHEINTTSYYLEIRSAFV